MKRPMYFGKFHIQCCAIGHEFLIDVISTRDAEIYGRILQAVAESDDTKGFTAKKWIDDEIEWMQIEEVNMTLVGRCVKNLEKI